MGILVHKYGGTSVDGPERIRAVAERVAQARRAGHPLIVVVSAMGHTTDELLRLARQVAPAAPRREIDMLLTAGERISMSLLAIALNQLGVEAISFTGSQSGILTDAAHNFARIVDIRPQRIRDELKRGRVVIVAGFQGVNPDTKEVTTLGRGGSDTSAVALAAAFRAERCEIYTDVRGVLTADPRLVPGAFVLERIGYAPCSALARLGGRVLHARSVDLAARHRVHVAVRSSFEEHPGTVIDEGGDMERPLIQAVAHQEDRAVMMAEGTAGARAETRAIIEAVAEELPELELVAHEQMDDAHAALVWTGSREDAEELKARWNELRGPGGEWRLTVQHGAGFVSLVGLGLSAREGARAERVLERAHIPLHALRLTPTAIVLRVSSERVPEAVRALHAEFLEKS
jgi:aspartate kinase